MIGLPAHIVVFGMRRDRGPPVDETQSILPKTNRSRWTRLRQDNMDARCCYTARLLERMQDAFNGGLDLGSELAPSVSEATPCYSAESCEPGSSPRALS